MQAPKIRIFHSSQRKKQVRDRLGQGSNSVKRNFERRISRETMNKENVFGNHLLEDSDTAECCSENVSYSNVKILSVNGVYNRDCNDSLGNFMKESKLEVSSCRMSNFNDFRNTDMYMSRNLHDSKKFNSSSLKNIDSANSSSISGIISSQSNSPSNKRNSDEILALFKETDVFVESGGNVEENIYIDRGNYRNTIPNEIDVPACKKKCPDTFFDDESQMLDESFFHDEIQNSIEIEDQLVEQRNCAVTHTASGRWSANQSTSGRWSANQTSIGSSVPQDTDVEQSDDEINKGKFQVDQPRICNKDRGKRCYVIILSLADLFALYFFHPRQKSCCTVINVFETNVERIMQCKKCVVFFYFYDDNRNCFELCLLRKLFQLQFVGFSTKGCPELNRQSSLKEFPEAKF